MSENIEAASERQTNQIEAWAKDEYREGVSSGAAARQLCRSLGANGEGATLKKMLEDMLGSANKASFVRSQLLNALRELDAYWTADFPGGPDGPRTTLSGFGEVSEDTMAVWRSVRHAIALAEGLS